MRSACGKPSAPKHGGSAQDLPCHLPCCRPPRASSWTASSVQLRLHSRGHSNCSKSRVRSSEMRQACFSSSSKLLHLICCHSFIKLPPCQVRVMPQQCLPHRRSCPLFCSRRAGSLLRSLPVTRLYPRHRNPLPSLRRIRLHLPQHHLQPVAQHHPRTARPLMVLVCHAPARRARSNHHHRCPPSLLRHRLRRRLMPKQ